MKIISEAQKVFVESYSRVLKDSTTRVITRDGVDGYVRTALIIDRNKTGSVDVLDQDGVLVCRLNITVDTCEEEERGKEFANVDVILNPENQVGTFLAWKEGREVVRERLVGNTVFAVDIRGRAREFKSGR